MKRLFFLFLLALAVTIGACNKKTNDPPVQTTDDDTITAEDHSTSEAMFEDAFNVVDESIKEDGRVEKTQGANAILNGCTTITVDTTGAMLKMTIDFGTGCTGNDGRERSGKILVTLSGRYSRPGSVISIEFDDYHVNGNKIEGKKTVTFKGLNADNQPYFSIKVTGGKVTLTSGKTITWESERTRVWEKGFNTGTPMDDEYNITGTASGTNRNGLSYTAKITTPLHVKIGCRWIESGTLTIRPDNKADRIIDYGNGDCDNKATVTINSKTHDLTLR
jgi:hypothetical protein